MTNHNEMKNRIMNAGPEDKVTRENGVSWRPDENDCVWGTVERFEEGEAAHGECRIAVIDGGKYDDDTGQEQSGVFKVWLCYHQLETAFSNKDISAGDTVGIKRLEDEPDNNMKHFCVRADKADRSGTGDEPEDRFADSPNTDTGDPDDLLE